MLNLAVNAVTEVHVHELGGRPDIGVTVAALLSGYIELKAPGKGANPAKLKGADKAQWQKFQDLPNLIYTDGNEWALFRNGERVGTMMRLARDVSAMTRNAQDDPWLHFHLSPYFEEIFGSELDRRLREKADLIAYILKTKQIGCCHCIMVGDRKHDIIGAQANKVPTIGVTYGYGSREELQIAGAGTLADTPEDLEKAVTDAVLSRQRFFKF